VLVAATLWKSYIPTRFLPAAAVAGSAPSGFSTRKAFPGELNLIFEGRCPGSLEAKLFDSTSQKKFNLTAICSWGNYRNVDIDWLHSNAVIIGFSPATEARLRRPARRRGIQHHLQPLG